MLTWHGIFVAAGVAAGVWVAAQIARRYGFIDDDIYGIAIFGVITGMAGARLLFLAENFDRVDWPLGALRINEGGISLWGGIIGGLIGGVVYGGWYKRLPLWRGLDAGAFGLILGQGIGRVGDIINGEHVSRSSDLPWAVEWTNINSMSFARGPMHPVVAYEFLGDMVIFGLLFVLLARYRTAGLTFFSYLIMYSTMRFGITYLRWDSKEVLGQWMNVPQTVSAVMLVVALAGVWWRLRAGDDDSVVPAPQTSQRLKATTALSAARRR
ncbi:MAG: hypothetical protein EPO22_12605 [Dehalococcoidia bacterium]|nr:MAG: hypothetical protein EPO22_12605 [Dehalococcoidia bacterium]